jgi:hypothetical protein
LNQSHVTTDPLSDPLSYPNTLRILATTGQGESNTVSPWPRGGVPERESRIWRKQSCFCVTTPDPSRLLGTIEDQFHRVLLPSWISRIWRAAFRHSPCRRQACRNVWRHPPEPEYPPTHPLRQSAPGLTSDYRACVQVAICPVRPISGERFRHPRHAAFQASLRGGGRWQQICCSPLTDKVPSEEPLASFVGQASLCSGVRRVWNDSSPRDWIQ